MYHNTSNWMTGTHPGSKHQIPLPLTYNGMPQETYDIIGCFLTEITEDPSPDKLRKMNPITIGTRGLHCYKLKL